MGRRSSCSVLLRCAPLPLFLGMFRKNLSREPDFCNHGQSPTKETQGRPQLRLQKSYLFQVPKTNPKLAPCTCLSWSWFFFESGTADVALRLGSEIGPSLSWSWQSFSFCSVDERGPVFPKPAIEARRGLAETRLVSPKHKITVNCTFFLTGALCLSAGRGVLRLTRLPRHDRGPVPGGIDPRLPETGILPLLDEIA